MDKDQNKSARNNIALAVMVICLILISIVLITSSQSFNPSEVTNQTSQDFTYQELSNSLDLKNLSSQIQITNSTKSLEPGLSKLVADCTYFVANFVNQSSLNRLFISAPSCYTQPQILLPSNVSVSEFKSVTNINNFIVTENKNIEFITTGDGEITGYTAGSTYSIIACLESDQICISTPELSTDLDILTKQTTEFTQLISSY